MDFLIKGGDIQWFHFHSKGDFPRGRISSPNEGPHRTVLGLFTGSSSRAQRSEKPLCILPHPLTHRAAAGGYSKPLWSYLHGLHLRGVDHRGGLSCLNDSLDLDLLSGKLNDREGSRTSERHLQQTKNHQEKPWGHRTQEVQHV